MNEVGEANVQRTAADYFDHWSLVQPDAVYVVDHSLERAEEVYTYGQFAVLVQKTARALQNIGIGSGDVVAIAQ